MLGKGVLTASDICYLRAGCPRGGPGQMVWEGPTTFLHEQSAHVMKVSRT